MTEVTSAQATYTQVTSARLTTDWSSCLPACEPLGRFKYTPRWRHVAHPRIYFWMETSSATGQTRHWAGGRSNVVDRSSVASAPKGTSVDRHLINSLRMQWICPQGKSYLLTVSLPVAGWTHDLAIDWTSVHTSVRTGEIDTNASAWMEWTVERAQQALQSAGLTHFVLHLVDQPDVPLVPEYAALSFELMPEAIWTLRGSTDAVTAIWNALVAAHPTAASASHSAFMSQSPAVQNLIVQTWSKWQLSLSIAPLTPTQTAHLRVGCLLLLDTESGPQDICVHVHAQTLPDSTNNPLIATATLALRIRHADTNDQMHLQWNNLMSKPTLTDPNSSFSSHDAIHTRLQCVLGTQDLRLNDLLHLRPGDLLPIHELPLPHVTLMMGHQVLGTGELVRCADTVAVQIVEWFASDDAENNAEIKADASIGALEEHRNPQERADG